MRATDDLSDATARGCVTSCATSTGRSPSRRPSSFTALLAAEPSRRSASSRRYGAESTEKSYLRSSVLPMPSIVVSARKTNVHTGGKRNGRSACVANRSAPIFARRFLRARFFSSGVIWFSHWTSAPSSVDLNVRRYSRAMRSIE